MKPFAKTHLGKNVGKGRKSTPNHVGKGNIIGYKVTKNRRFPLKISIFQLIQNITHNYPIKTSSSSATTSKLLFFIYIIARHKI